MDQNARCLALIPDATQHLFDRVAVLWCDLLQEVAAHEAVLPPHRDGQGGGRRAVGLNDPQVGDLGEQHGLVGILDHEAISRLDFSQFPIIAFDGLLRGNQAGLEFGNSLQVLADRQHAGAAAQQHGGELHRQLEAAGKPLCDLSKCGDPAPLGIGHDAFDLVARAIDDLGPRATEPGVNVFARHRSGERRLANDAVHVEQQGHIGLRSVELRHRHWHPGSKSIAGPRDQFGHAL